MLQRDCQLAAQRLLGIEMSFRENKQPPTFPGVFQDGGHTKDNTVVFRDVSDTLELNPGKELRREMCGPTTISRFF